MLSLLPSLLLTCAVLTVILWIVAAWLQAFLYNEPEPQLFWRAPAAGLLLMLWLGYWSFLSHRSPGQYDALFQISPYETEEFKEFWVEKGNQKIHYVLRYVSQGDLPPRREYREDVPPHRLWSRSDAVLVKQNDQEVRFEVERDSDKNYKIDPYGGGVRYRDPQGRVMTEGALGRITTFRSGLFWSNLFFNLFFGIVGFAALWLLLRFQLLHALSLSVVLWLVMIVAVVPLLL